ncbi:MAG: hypothetical protein MUF83_08920 [Acidimicrobiales bacterium]|jgi:hypothetical protein|nr:hypothetical protein [Acidimicrobiales bacterium]
MSKPVRYTIYAVIGLVVLAAAVAALRLEDSPSQASDQIIEAVIPGQDEKTLLQGKVGVDLIAGWDAELAINGTPIPADQLNKANGLGQVLFQPGVGKELEQLQPGPNCATATYWQLAAPDQRFTRTWCFTAA